MGRRGVVFVAAIVMLGCATARGSGAPPTTWGVTCAEPSFEAALARRTVEGLLDVAKRTGQPATHVTLKRTPTGFWAELQRAGVVVTRELPLAPHVLSGSTWAPLAEALVGTGDTPTSSSLDVLASVEHSVSLRTLLATSTAVARQLRETPRSAALREQSALLLVVLALREAGPLIDPHEPLALATAQLALAHALRGGAAASTEGRAAQAVVHALAGDEGAALSALDASGTGSWMKAVRLLATGDWRQPADAPPPPDGLERLARYRELRFRAGALKAQDAHESWASLDDPLWARMVFTTGMHQSVVDARRYGEDLPARERAELELIRGLDLDEVIPSGVLQRHLLRNAMSAALVQYTLFAETLALPKNAARVRDAADREFGEDPLWAAASVLLRKQPPASVCARAKKGLDALTPSVRQVVSMRCGGRAFDADALAALTPRNTVYNADNRLQWLRVKASPTWATLSPHSYPVRAAQVRALKQQDLEAAQVLAMLGPLADYDLRALHSALTLSAAPSREVLEKRCELDADTCDDLVNHLREEKLEFIDVLERWRRDPRTRVAFSELSRPLLDAYFEQQRLDDAALLAQEVEDVGSSRGLEVAAVFAERMGRYDVAERKYLAHARRYGRRDLLDDFYLRAEHRQYPGDWRRQAADAAQRVFGGPPQKVTKRQLSETDAGVRMGDERDPAYRHFGIKKGDVVLSVDGYRVKNLQQLLALAHRTEAPTLTVVVVRDAELVELTGPFRRQRYGR